VTIAINLFVVKHGESFSAGYAPGRLDSGYLTCGYILDIKKYTYYITAVIKKNYLSKYPGGALSLSTFYRGYIWGKFWLIVSLLFRLETEIILA
jgi:hypothetical protein